MHALIKGHSVVDRNVFWQRWYRDAKAKLIGGLDFNTCNDFLEGIHLLLKEFLATGNTQPIVRLLYLIISYFLISLDFTSRTFSQLEVGERIVKFTEGLRYGEAGPERAREVIDMALNLLASSGKADLFTKTNIKKEFQEQLDVFPAEILGEHFSKNESLKHLFDLAREFESNAYAPNLVMPSECRSEQKAIIGLLCDFWGMDRKKVI